jgi:UDP-N-acetylglucosamine:LPS N-acetylglucosamine transferase
VRVPVAAAPALLAERIEELLEDRARRASVSEAARAHAGASSFDRVADSYLEALGLS